MGSNIKYKSKATYKKARIVEVQVAGEKILIFTVQAFIKNTLGIAIKGNNTYQFNGEEWQKISKASGVISSIMISDQEIFIRAKFGHENNINSDNVYIDRHEMDAIFQIYPTLIELLQKYQVKFYDFRVALN